MKILRALFVPTFWCGTVIADKEKAFFDQPGYDVVFLGTSRVNHGFNPKVFDKTMKEELKNKKRHTRTFNFGISGASVGEMFYVANEVLDQKAGEIEFILLELCSVGTALGDKFCVENLHTNRNKYWMDGASLKFAVGNALGFENNKVLFEKESFQLTRGERWKYAFNYGVNFVENQLNVGMMNSFVGYYYGKLPVDRGRGINGDGYNNIQLLRQKGVKKARKGFLKNKGVLFKKNKASKEYFSGDFIKDDYNDSYYDAMIALTKKAETKGIRLIWVAPPLMAVESYEELSPIFDQLPPANKINLASAKTYPQLYLEEHTWDGNHLNHKGTNAFTKLLAKKFIDKVYRK